MKFIAGSRVRFTARFNLLQHPFDPGEVKGSVVEAGNARPVTVQRAAVGVYWFEMIARAGALVVTFTASSGEESATTHEVEVAQAFEAPAESSYVPPEPVAPRFDRAAARTTLLAAGIAVDDQWSEAKIRSALEGLEDNARQRRAWKF